MLNRIQVKSEAKQIVRTAHVSPLLISTIVLAVTFVPERVMDLARYGDLFYSLTLVPRFFAALMSGDPAAMDCLRMIVHPSDTQLSSFVVFLADCFIIVLMGGFYAYSIGVRRGKVMRATSLLDGLNDAGQLILCNILVSVKIALWSLLFVVPGIIAAYRYRFAFYNLIDYSRLTANEAIKLSCDQTRGMKKDLFVLDLSFLGWSILSILTLGILDILVLPYQTQCRLAYFEEGQRRVDQAGYQ